MLDPRGASNAARPGAGSGPGEEEAMKDVRDKVAFVTGAASGIGLGMARAFLKADMKVVLADVRETTLANAVASLEVPEGRLHSIAVDVTDRAAMARAAERTLAVFGKVHVLCNNAGVGGNVSIDEAGYDEWDWVFGVNVGGVINGIRSFLPHIRAHGEGGHIVNTSSIGGLLPLPPPVGVYSASKFAVRGISDALRLALAYSNIGVSVLCPGLVRSEIAANARRLSPAGADAMPPPDPGQLAMLAAGMDPLQVGERVLQGIRGDQAYILPHGEFRDEVREVFDEILAAFPEHDIDPARLPFENGRRDAVRAMKAAMKVRDRTH